MLIESTVLILCNSTLHGMTMAEVALLSLLMLPLMCFELLSTGLARPVVEEENSP